MYLPDKFSVSLSHHVTYLLVTLLLLCCSSSGQQEQQGHWGEWGQISPCSVTCGEGVQEKVRVWIRGPNDPVQTKPFTNTQMFSCTPVNFAECPTDGKWSAWFYSGQCSVMCSGGTRKRTRECMGIAHGGKTCEGEKESTETCNTRPCPRLPPNFDMSQCTMGQNYTCESGKMCIPGTERCDGTLHCHDGTDEKNCTFPNRGIGPGDGASFLQTSFSFIICAVMTVFAVLLVH